VPGFVILAAAIFLDILRKNWRRDRQSPLESLETLAPRLLSAWAKKTVVFNASHVDVLRTEYDGSVDFE